MTGSLTHYYRQGSVMEDCCTVFCCPGCAIIQLHKQIDPRTNILGLQK